MVSDKKQVVVIGSGAGGLGSACLLAKKGYRVTLVEKNERVGGRVAMYKQDGYRFDMGASWYMMPGVYNQFYKLMGTTAEQEMKMRKLEPSYRIWFEGQDEPIDIKSDRTYMKELFDSIESGAGDKLIQHLDEGKYQFDIAEREFMYKNYNSIFDFFNWRLLRDGSKLPILKSMDKIISSRFRSPVLQKILAYQTVLLGTSPKECPGIYSLMNHIDIDQAIWYPEGGLSAITDSLVRLFEQHGGTLRTAAPAQRIVLDEGVHRATGVELESGEFLPADYVISNADLTFTDEVLLGKAAERDQKYWESKRMSPSGFILYLGVDGEIDTLTHHNLYFIKDWDKGNREVFHGDILPEHPSYYVCCSSKSDKTIAPPGKENLFVLVPVAPGLTVDAATQNAFEDQVLDHMESTLNIPNFRVRIEHKRRYTFENFTEDYNAYKGNALSGMSHTLRQTAVFRPNNIHQTYRNVLFAGAGTNPGIGVPTSLISAEMVYKRIEGITDSSPLDAL